jgi:hypothetical protein
LTRPREACAFEREFEPAILDAHQSHVGFERGLGQEIALLAGERNELRKA